MYFGDWDPVASFEYLGYWKNTASLPPDSPSSNGSRLSPSLRIFFNLKAPGATKDFVDSRILFLHIPRGNEKCKDEVKTIIFIDNYNANSISNIFVTSDKHKVIKVRIGNRMNFLKNYLCLLIFFRCLLL